MLRVSNLTRLGLLNGSLVATQPLRQPSTSAFWTHRRRVHLVAGSLLLTLTCVLGFQPVKGMVTGDLRCATLGVQRLSVVVHFYVVVAWRKCLDANGLR